MVLLVILRLLLLLLPLLLLLRLLLLLVPHLYPDFLYKEILILVYSSDF